SSEPRAHAGLGDEALIPPAMERVLMIDRRRIPWVGIGVLAAAALLALALCCLCSPYDPAPPPCDAAPPAVVAPAPPEDAAADAATEDAAAAPCQAAPPDAASPVLLAPGPSCGSHPWCPHPKPCCSDMLDCCD
ncbi:MAG: hypothetical protein ACLQVI_03500, partial [Polyangiaceae bacterium]